MTNKKDNDKDNNNKIELWSIQNKRMIQKIRNYTPKKLVSRGKLTLFLLWSELFHSDDQVCLNQKLIPNSATHVFYPVELLEEEKISMK